MMEPSPPERYPCNPEDFQRLVSEVKKISHAIWKRNPGSVRWEDLFQETIRRLVQSYGDRPKPFDQLVRIAWTAAEGAHSDLKKPHRRCAAAGDLQHYTASRCDLNYPKKADLLNALETVQSRLAPGSRRQRMAGALAQEILRDVGSVVTATKLGKRAWPEVPYDNIQRWACAELNAVLAALENELRVRGFDV
jgi:hypothetical protein